MATACKYAIRVFVAAYVAALLLFAIGTFGLFGQEPGPLAGIFLIPLGLPWNQLLDAVPDTLRPWLAVAAPVLNILILMALCQRLRGR